MAATKIHPIKVTLKKAIDYICNPAKTDGEVLISSFNCSHKTAALEFQLTLDQVKMKKGNNKAHHLFQSFKIGEVKPEKAHEIGRRLAEEVLGGKYEYVLATHIDKKHIHNHIIFCAVDFINYRKFNSNKKSYYRIRNINDRLCKEEGLSVIPPNHGKGKTYKEWLENKNGNSWKAKLKKVIDEAVLKSDSFEDFLGEIKKKNYEIKFGEHIAFRAKGQERFTRMKVLGEQYREESIRQIINNPYLKNQFVIKNLEAENDSTLIKKIETSIKIHEVKGNSYKEKINLLKHAARTINYLSEEKIYYYDEIEKKQLKLTSEMSKQLESLKKINGQLKVGADLTKMDKLNKKKENILEEYFSLKKRISELVRAKKNIDKIFRFKNEKEVEKNNFL
ncbi:relaxase/mobilization nuclease domain-containing protein [Enterococcus plantarum]|uniref:relaxase/mobilization nuclease domain-containing protein n=1 Tax=Enterococcus plantarum TaxID=1077675 RepID=UPI001A8DCCEE|nr:relaxase/mobilization nuclease domain-containing protein [Enterococcus plantarum]MBO0468530.1 relaxase/mobilization nuclease domain-containing protein [Enterococcus plantarum]